MHLKFMETLPRRAIEKLGDDIDDVVVYLVQDYSGSLLKRIVEFGLNIFGELGVDEWGLVPQIRHGNVFVLQASGQRRLLGMAILMRDWEDLEKCYLYDFAIADELQAKGLGFNFFSAIVRNLREQGFRRVDVENAPAVRLYQDKVGFRIVGRTDDEYGEGHDRFLMELELAEATLSPPGEESAGAGAPEPS